MKNVVSQLMQDVQELLRTSVNAPKLSEVLVSDRFHVLVLQRLRERARKHRVPLVNTVLRRVSTVMYGLEIGNEVTVGDGVSFVHPIANVVGGDAKIGHRVRFMGNVTVGTAKENGYPIIEDDVTIGAGARVLGPVVVGRGSIIGANAVVVRDVPPNSIVTGVPGVARPNLRLTEQHEGERSPHEDDSTPKSPEPRPASSRR